MNYIQIIKDNIIKKGDNQDDEPKSILLECYETLYKVLHRYCKIDQLILLNFGDKYITQSDIEDYLRIPLTHRMLTRSIGERDYHEIIPKGEETSYAKVLAELKIFNLFDFGIVKPEDPRIDHLDGYSIIDGYSLKEINLTPLINITKNEPVITCPSEFSLLFLRLLSELENVTLYRKSYKFEAKEMQYYYWVEEKKIKDYYFFHDSLLQIKNKQPYKIIPPCFVACFEVRGRLLNLNQQFIKDFCSLAAGKIKKAILIGSEDLIVKYMLRDLEKSLGSTFLWQDAADGNTDISIIGERLIIYNAQKLNASICNKLSNSTSSKKQKNNIILLHSHELVETIKDSSFKIILLPSNEQIKSVLSRIILFMINECFSDIPDWKLNESDIIYLQIYDILEIFNKIIGKDDDRHTLSDIEYEILELKYKRTFSHFDFSDGDFWWEFKNYIDKKYPTAKTEEKELEQTLEEKKELVQEKEIVLGKEVERVKEQEPNRKNKNITFEHVKNNWIITSKGFEGKIDTPIKEPYDNLALKYVTYLVKYYENPSDKCDKYINAKVLYSQVRDWNKTERKSKEPGLGLIQSQIESYFNPKSSRNKIHEDLDTLTIKKKKRLTKFREQLGKIIREYFTIKNDCYYEQPKDFEIIIKIDKDMEHYKLRN
jgi:hypothetical protein